MNQFEWTEPPTLVGVAEALDDADAALKAGGIDLLDLMKEGLVEPRRLVGLGRLEALRAIEATPEGGLRVGALSTLAEVASHPVIAARYRALADAAGHSATPQIRNVATLGGNLLQRSRCWYYRSRDFPCLRKAGTRCFAQEGRNRYHALFLNDRCAMVHPSTPATALVALGASVVLRAPSGAVRRVDIEEFFVPPSKALDRETIKQPEEILVAVDLPPVDETFRSRHRKQGERESFDWPIADVAAAFRLVNGRVRSARIALGAAAPVPLRRLTAERNLEGQRLDANVADRAARSALEGARPLTENAYKLLVFRSIIRRTLLDAAREA